MDIETKKIRIRQTNEEREQERIEVMRLFSEGYSKKAIKLVLKINNRKLASHLSDSVFREEGIPEISSETLIVTAAELSEDFLSFLKADKTSLIEFSFQSHTSDGIFSVLPSA